MSKNISKSSIDWAKLGQLVPPADRHAFLAFKAKSDSYLRRVLASPAEPPKIDWEHYKKMVPVEGLVDKFKSQYESMKVPYPDDKYSAEVDKQWSSLEPEVNKFCDEMQKDIDGAQKELSRIKALPAYDVITMEMFFDMFPNEAIKFVEKPSLWPHTADEQMGYIDPNAKASDHH